MDAELFDKKAPKIDEFRSFLAPSARFERAAFRLGVSQIGYFSLSEKRRILMIFTELPTGSNDGAP